MSQRVAFDGTSPPEDERYSVRYQQVAGDYFTAIGIPVLRGRALGEIDRGGRPLVAVINETMAREVFGDEDPLGHRFTFVENGLTAGSFTIVGVVGNARQQSLEQASEPQFVRAVRSGAAKSHGHRGEERRSESEHAFHDARAAVEHPVRSSDQAARADDRLPLRIDCRFTVLRIVAGRLCVRPLSLALVGIYGTLSYAVSQRTHEMGVRMALGAGATSVLSLVIRRGMTLVAIGAVGGVGTGVLVNRVLESFMFGITSTDPATIVGGVAAVVLASFLACVVPAWRAARLDPMVALRGE